jgi:hypothetical protein
MDQTTEFSQQLQSLVDFLRNYAVDSADKANLLSMTGRPKPGRWFIPRETYGDFLQLVWTIADTDSADWSTEDNDFGARYHAWCLTRMCFVETWTSTGPYKTAFDLDITEPVTANDIDVFLKLVFAYLAIPEESRLYVVKSSDPKIVNGNEQFSYHIIFPSVVVTDLLHFHCMIGELKTSGIKLAKYLDASIYNEHKGLRLTGCYKGKDERVSFIADKSFELSWADSSLHQPPVEPIYVWTPESQPDYVSTPPPNQEQMEPTSWETTLRDRVSSQLRCVVKTVTAVQKGQPGHRLKLKTHWCEIANENHTKHSNRCLTVGRYGCTYTCLYESCANTKLTMKNIFSLSELADHYPDTEKTGNKKKKSKRDLSSYQVLIKYLVNEARTQDLMKTKDGIWKRHKIGERFSGAVEFVGDFPSWVVEVTSEVYNAAMYDVRLTCSIDNAVKEMKICKEIPTVTKIKHLLSFRNGVWDGETEKFREPDERISLSFIDIDFDPKWLEMEPEEMPTPIFDHLLSTQGLSASIRPEDKDNVPFSEIAVVHAMIGRSHYDVGKKDDDQLWLYFKGEAGSGKSKIVYANKSVWHEKDIGIVQNNSQDTFVWANIAHKLKWIGNELGPDWSQDDTVLNSIISGGDPVSFAIKHVQQTLDLPNGWTSQGEAHGNFYPGKLDNPGKHRRLLIVICDVVSEEVIPGINKKLDEEKGIRVVKQIRLYNKWCKARYLEPFGNQRIWKILPSYFQNNKLQKAVNALDQFLASDDVVLKKDDNILSPRLFCPLSTFGTAYKKWANDMGYPKVVWNEEFYKKPFVAAKIGLIGANKVTKTWPRHHGIGFPKASHGAFITGVDLAEFCTEDEKNGSF